jgi:hypothetical protein
MERVAYCTLCEMDRDSCEHGLAERRRTASASASTLLISPSSMAHFPRCPHKDGDPDYSRWAELDTPRAWERLGTASNCPPPVARAVTSSLCPGVRTASITGCGSPADPRPAGGSA